VKKSGEIQKQYRKLNRHNQLSLYIFAKRKLARRLVKSLPSWFILAFRSIVYAILLLLILPNNPLEIPIAIGGGLAIELNLRTLLFAREQLRY
jgi:hypothetical protein